MNANTVTTGKVRFSYAKVAKPEAQTPGQEPKYTMAVLIPKSDTATKAAIDAAIEAAAIAGVAGKWGGTRPTRPAVTMYDGDGLKPKSGEPYGPECKGHWVLNCSARAERPPFVVDARNQPIIGIEQIAKEIYSGAYGRVNLTFYAYNTNGNRGIGCGLNGVQKLEDGEPLGGGVTAEEAFGAPVTADYTNLWA